MVVQGLPLLKALFDAAMPVPPSRLKSSDFMPRASTAWRFAIRPLSSLWQQVEMNSSQSLSPLTVYDHFAPRSRVMHAQPTYHCAALARAQRRASPPIAHQPDHAHRGSLDGAAQRPRRSSQRSCFITPIARAPRLTPLPRRTCRLSATAILRSRAPA